MRRDFEISVAAAPDGRLDLVNELQLIKVGILYADRTVLCSPKTILFMFLGTVMEFTEDQQLDLIETLVPTIERDPAKAGSTLRTIQRLRRLRQKHHRSSFERRQLKEFREVLASTFEELRTTLGTQFESAGVYQVLEAIRSGLLTIHPLAKDGQMDNVVPEFMDFLTSTLKAQSSFPLYDNFSGSIIQAGIREGKLPPAVIGSVREKNVPLAANLFCRLPLFELATVSEILDIRRDLEKPLTRFRSAMLRLAGDVHSMPWEDSFAADVETILHREIEPAILEINESIESNKYLKEVFRRTVDKPLALAGGSALGMAISTMGNLPFITATALATGAGGVVELIKAHQEWRQQQDGIERNQLYFYYRLNRVNGLGHR